MYTCVCTQTHMHVQREGGREGDSYYCFTKRPKPAKILAGIWGKCTLKPQGGAMTHQPDDSPEGWGGQGRTGTHTDGNSRQNLCFGQFLHPPLKLSICLSCEPSVPFLGTYPTEWSVLVRSFTYAYITTFGAVLCIIISNWNQPKCLSTAEWVNKL